MCAPFFLVCSRLTTCVHAHSLEGKLVANRKSRNDAVELGISDEGLTEMLICHTLHEV